MRYLELLPVEPLRRHVECLWFLTGPAPRGAASAQRILPDGCMELVFNLSDPFLRHHEDGSVERHPVAILVGQQERQIELQPSGALDLVGVRFQPAGAFPFLAFPASELTGTIVASDPLTRSWTDGLADRLAVVRAPVARRCILEAALHRRLERAETVDLLAAAAAETILASAGLVRIDRLADTVGVSRRGLERRFARHVGLRPKALARIARLQAALGAARRTRDPRWSELAAACGYYDQAHLIGEFRRIGGATPPWFLAPEQAIAHLFIRGSRPSQISKTPREALAYRAGHSIEEDVR